MTKPHKGRSEDRELELWLKSVCDFNLKSVVSHPRGQNKKLFILNYTLLSCPPQAENYTP